jgi:hypothetical protein
MLVKFSQGPDLDGREKSIAVNPADVMSVEKSRRSNDWAVITLRGGAEHTVIGTVEAVMAALDTMGADK